MQYFQRYSECRKTFSSGLEKGVPGGPKVTRSPVDEWLYYDSLAGASIHYICVGSITHSKKGNCSGGGDKRYNTVLTTIFNHSKISTVFDVFQYTSTRFYEHRSKSSSLQNAEGRVPITDMDFQQRKKAPTAFLHISHLSSWILNSKRAIMKKSLLHHSLRSVPLQ